MTVDQAAVTGPPQQIPLHLMIGFVAMVVGLFLAVLDIMIVISSIGEIQSGLSASVDEISWVQTSFLIAETITILITGWLVGIFSTRWLFTAAALGFTIMSAACAGAWDIWSMVVFRSFQGIFAGVMIPTVFAAVYRALPENRQGGALVVVSLVATLAPALGPSLGGWITQSFSWHWLFLVNVVPGIVVAALVWRFVDIDKPNLELLKRIDGWGLILIFTLLGVAIYVLEEGPGDDWFESRFISILTVIVGVSALSLIWRELNTERPIIDLRAFRNRNFSIGCIYSFLFGVGLFGSLFLIPLFLVTVRGFNSLQVGIVMMVAGVTQFLAGPLVGRLQRYIPRRALLAVGFTAFGVSLYMNGTLTSEAGFDQLFWPQILRGLGIMFCFLPITTIALGLLPKEEVNNASGIYNLTRTLGGGIGIAALNTAVDFRFDVHYLRIAETMRVGARASSDMLDGLSARFGTRLADAAQADLAALEAVKRIAEREATTMAFNDAFLMLAGFFALALLLMPLLRSVGGRTSEAKP